ncbi:MAG: UPF0182 family protein [Gemmatimonadales bacterium]|nr:UPF0182 family protein [Gemmatimonadales bacterium]
MPKALPGNRPSRKPAFILLAIVIMLLLSRAVAVQLTDWLWFREVGFERVFLLRFTAGGLLWVLAGVLGFAVIYGNARIAMRGIEEVTETVQVLAEGGIQMRERFLTKLASLLALPLAAFLSLGLATSASSQWRTLIQYFYRTPFGDVDPVFGRDIAYYVFTLPTIQLFIDLASGALMISLLVMVLPIYLVRGDISIRHGALRTERNVELHASVLIALLLLIQAARLVFVMSPSLLFGTHGPLQGASLADLTIMLPAYRALAVLLVVGAGAMLWSARRGRVLRSAATVVGGYIVLSVLFTAIVPSMYQRLVVQPNELARETPQIVHHIAATRRAWGLDKVQLRELEGDQVLSAQDLERNRATIDNVRLWDREPLLQTFGQLQAIRTYYDFVGVDDDRYMVNGALRHVLLSARELDASALPTRTFVNEHLTFTHGMGLTMGPSNQVTAEGLPVLWVQDLPPVATNGLVITQPQIYFGELPTSYVLAPSRQREFDYPSREGDEAVYSAYAGKAGVPIDAFWRRALFAMRFQAINILLSQDFTPETKILFYQNVRDRAEKALPFLSFDPDPYLVVSDSGRLKWMLDAYTSTSRYPYSARTGDGTNYLRNSVKVVIDAYDGDVLAYVSEPDDPIVQTLGRVYPGLLRPLDEMEPGLRAHVRYPEALFSAQTSLYATFHMTDPETFYHREDQWQIPVAQRGGVTSGYQRHIVMRLPGEESIEYLIMRPFTPRQKDNLAAWMVARNDGEHYGELISYRFPRQSLIYGPSQITSRINQDTEVSRQVSLWDQGGSEVIRGELLVIPIEASLLYVQPIYLRASGGKIPELKRVVVAHEGRVVMEETFDRALRTLFGDEAAAGRPAPARAIAGSTPASTATENTAQRDALTTQALQHYDRARAAQRADDWATYGREMQQLGEVLRRLREMRPPR